VKRILVAGVGNVLLGDDGFGVEVVRRLHRRGLAGAEVRDFGIRGQDLALALLDDWRGVVIVDAARRGRAPGTLTVIEPVPGRAAVMLGWHGMDPAAVLAAVRAMGGSIARRTVRLLACEPAAVPGDDDDLVMGLSECVAACVDPACAMVEALVRELAAAAEEVERA
jgi:hydrogenase maturation protease